MKTLRMLHEIEKRKLIYNIHYCLCGVGFQFYDPPKGLKVDLMGSEWRKYLTTDRYYPTFEKAVKAEFKRLK